MQEYAYSAWKTEAIVLDPHQRVWEWHGSKTLPIALSESEFEISPVPLRKIALDNEHFETTVYVRKDIGSWWALYYWLVGRWLTHTYYFERFQQKLIVTAHVWGLAYIPPGEVPNWECIGKRSAYRPHKIRPHYFRNE